MGLSERRTMPFGVCVCVCVCVRFSSRGSLTFLSFPHPLHSNTCFQARGGGIFGTKFVSNAHHITQYM